MKQNSLSPGETPADSTRPGRTGSLPRILVVDDEPDLRQISTEVLTQSGYEVDVAEDGDVAWEALQQNGYDLLVTDYRMPTVSGVELLKRIHTAGLALPVIMATGAWPRAEFIREPWLQPALTLLKPYTNAELLAAVQDVLCTAAQISQTVPAPGKNAPRVNTP